MISARKITVVTALLSLFAFEGWGGLTAAQAASVGARDGRDGRPAGLSGGPVNAEQPVLSPRARPLTPTEKANPGLKPYSHDPINQSGHSENRWFLVRIKQLGGGTAVTRFITHYATISECKEALKSADAPGGDALDCREVPTWVND